MKILHIEGGRNFYGGALQVFYLIRELSSHNVENVLVCSDNSDLIEKAMPYSEVYGLTMKSDLDFFLIVKIFMSGIKRICGIGDLRRVKPAHLSLLS